MHKSTKLAALCIVAHFPLMLALAFALKEAPTQTETIFDNVSKYALAYESTVDKEEYMASIYDDVKGIDETLLPQELQSFVIKVKVSQFGKPE